MYITGGWIDLFVQLYIVLNVHFQASSVAIPLSTFSSSEADY